MSVPAWIVELVTSSLTTREAEEMTLPNPVQQGTGDEAPRGARRARVRRKP
jgi:hypothetical protein